MMKRFTRWKPRWKRASGLVLLAVLGLSTSDVLAGPTPIQTLYIPLPEEEILAAHRVLDPGLGDNSIRTVIGITAAGNGSVLYYDHWEDGYEPDLANPAQPSTEVWGDGDLSNGAPPGCVLVSCDAVNAGDVFILQNDVFASPRNPGTTLYDGRDKIGSTQLIAVTQAAWPVPSASTLLAGAIEVFSTNDWGIEFVVPAGEDFSTSADDMFQDSRIIVMAQRDGTVVRVDLDDDGVDDVVQTLNEGESLTVDGILVGSRVRSSLSVQTNLLTGDIGANFEARWFTLVPRSRWSNRYVAPVGTTVTGDEAVLLLFNPHATSLDVDVTTTGGTTTLTIPAGALVKSFLPTGSGALVESTDGRELIALAAVDDEGSAHDWGHTLLPTSTLATAVKVGWAPGSNDPSTENSSPVWVTAEQATTLSIDWNDDGTVDQTVAINALQSVRLYDADNDQTGARIFTTDGTLISAAWGQDPATASPASPALDLGTTVLPAPDIYILKLSELSQDVNGNGALDPGDTLLYTIFVLNTGVADADDTTIEDTPDPYTSYELGTTSVNAVPVADGAAPSTPFPLDEGGLNIGTLVPGNSATIRYERRVSDLIPPWKTQITNDATVVIGTGAASATSETTVLASANFRISKTSDLTGPAFPGDVIEYTILIENLSSQTQSGIDVDDPLPSGTTYVAGSTTATGTAVAGNFRDALNAASYANNDGSVSWATNWLEMNDDGDINGGDVRVVTDQLASRIMVRDDGNGIQRQANLTGAASATLSFVYRRESLDDAGEWVEVRVSSNGGGSWTPLERFAGPATDGGYTAVSYDISAFIAANTRISFFSAPSGMNNADIVYFDEIEIATTAVVTKTNQSPPSNPLFDGDPPNLVDPLDGFTVDPGEALTVTYRVQVDDPLAPYLPSIINTVTVDSNESATPATGTAVDPVAPGSVIGDRVWLDMDGDGFQDVGEVGLSNVRLTLYEDPDGIPGSIDDVAIGVVTTDGAGNYVFSGVYPLAAGNHYVEVDAATLPGGLFPSPGNNGGLSGPVNVTGNNALLDVDFGYTAAAGTGVLGDRLWSDADGDGLQDPGEIGIGGVTLDLVGPGADGIFGTGDDSIVATTVTAADGSYLFVGVAPGDYRIDVTDTGGVLAGYTRTSGPQSSTDPTPPIAVSPGTVDGSRDFGYRNPALFSVSDALWYDTDGDGVRDAGEAGLSGVSVSLFDAGGSLLGTTTSDANGDFQFLGLANGNYTVTVTDTSGRLTGLGPTTPPAVAGSLAVSVAGADVGATSFGYVGQGIVGEIVWSDADGDGVRDPGEPGIGGVTLDLVDTGPDTVFGTADDVVLATTTTAGDGSYSFTGVGRGFFEVRVTDTGGVLAGATQTGDPDAALDDVGMVGLRQGESDLSMNFGYRNAALGDVSGTVFDDADADGVEDGAENGIAGVTIGLAAAGPDGLFGTNDDVIAATSTTDANGDFVFPDVPDGDYRVVVTDGANVLNGYTLTSGLDAISLTVAGVDVSDVDFGYVRAPGTASIGTSVWIDANRDGVRNPSENGLANVTVNLFTPGPDGLIGTADDVFVTSTTTDLQGSYQLANLAAGDYFVELDAATLPAGLAPTTGTSNPTGAIQLHEGESYLDADFGYASSTGSALGDSVFYDANGDGFQDSGEPGIGGVDLTVSGPSGTFNVTTNPDGTWLVTGLAPGRYTVTVDTTTLPAGYNTTPTNGPASRGYTVTAGADYVRADFGFDAPAGTTGSIGDLVFFDANGDGVPGAGEDGMAGVTLSLLDASGNVVATATTGANGGYDFVGLPPGTYRVQVTDLNGALGGLNLSAGSSPSAPIVLAAGQDENGTDFGYSASGGVGSIGGLVWHDELGDGRVDPGESGMEGVTVDLWLDVNGNGVVDPGTDNLVRSASTDVLGEYEMNALPPGDYLVDVTDERGVLAGFTKTVGIPGVDGNSQADPYLVSLGAGTSDFTADFGYTAASVTAILGTTFFDVAGDGILNGLDSGISDVGVFLFRDLDSDGILDPGDARIGVATSNAAGDYVFADLPNGDFLVAVNVNGTFLSSSFQTTQTTSAGVQPVSLSGLSSPDNDFGFHVASTLVSITRFDVYEEQGRVVVEWVTGTEVGALGFYVFRWDPTAADYVQVNERMLPALNLPQGGRYRLVDDGAPRRGTVSYTVFEVEEGGGERHYGPFSSRVRPRGPGGAPMHGRFEAQARRRPRDVEERAARARERRQSLQQTRRRDRNAGPPQRGPRAQRFVKLTTTETGVHFVSAATIARELSLEESHVRELIIRNLLLLTHRGETAAHAPAPDGSGSGLYFYSESVDSPYTTENVHWLTLRRGELMAVVDASPEPDAAGHYVHHERIEKNAFAATVASKDPDEDFWYWNSLAASLPAASTRSYPATLSALDAFAATAALEVHVYGATSTPHRIAVRVNGIELGEGRFEDVGRRSFRFDVDSSLLVEGENLFELQAILEDGVAFDVLYVDRLDLYYPRRHAAVDGALDFQAVRSGTVDVTGLVPADAIVVDATNPRAPSWLTNVDRNGAVRFRTEIGRRYHVASASTAKTPRSELVESLDSLRNGRAEYLVLAPGILAEAAEELAAYREAQGMSTRVVTLETIHDELGHGIASPHNVKRLLERAYQSWQTPPRFVVLVGKGTYDYKDELGHGDNLFPTLLAGTPLGLYASDNRFADVVGDDGVPEMLLGRIPVLSDDELRAYVEKLSAFEGHGLGEAMFLADDTDAAGLFSSDSDELAAILPEHVSLDRIYLDAMDVAPARQELFARLDAGVGFVNYVGHGGLDRLANEGLLVAGDVPGLTNEVTGIFASLTCSVGRFEIPGWPSLGESLVVAPTGGFAAAWVPSGQSFNAQAMILNRAFVEGLYREDTRHVGEAVRRALEGFAADGQLSFMAWIYNLLGDPATLVR